MIYVITGGSGFIGKRLIQKFLARPDAEVHFLLRNSSPERLKILGDFWGAEAARALPLPGDLTAPLCGVDPKTIEALRGKVDHFFHLGAIYDLAADPAQEMLVNIEGTRNALALAEALGARRFHHMSSIAAAGLYEGVFREDMFDEAENLEHPYFASKHESEKVVRAEAKIPYRIYRPGLVVGDSRTGEMDKIDGPYYFFKLIQKLRGLLPPWAPMIGLEGGRINLVPVDFVVAATDVLAHKDGLDGRCFHLVDPDPRRVGDIFALFAGAAHAPRVTMRVNTALFGLLPRTLTQALKALTPVRRIRKALMKDLGLPEGILAFFNYPTRFDSREAGPLLANAGIKVPAIEDYAWRLWDYWERHLDPDLFIDRSLRGRVAGKAILVTGGSAGIGKATALRLAEAGARVLIVGRDQIKLDAALQEAKARGLKLEAHAADLADPAQCEALVAALNTQGGVEILINNAGRSMRRGIEHSYDRLHDFERAMQVNYFGALRLTLGLLPGMAQRHSGHVINISSIGVLTNAPRFSAYVASKAALEAFSRCAASEFLDRGVHFTTINMPLVRTAMIAPTKLYEHAPALSPEEAAELVVEAIVKRPSRIATPLGVFGQIVHAFSPRLAQIVMNTAFRMFPDSAAATGAKHEAPNADQIVFTQIMRGLYL
ncbi:NAD(P)-dependent dehydrogenase (short-subunit alcohol dehydrogenase family) [Rhodoblastus acidophilus]|uniref:SDR family oxidoreductase n=1 Tax=Rhodoblastus acidophilus TaxID=1074 RepID=UPI0022250881|nr:SDR family oxidoreductase [Rhodoblastus acidophilus]MCW2282379.1 NAD(P)-dependent dehydrogenase (short-subunit alcohol dehydrogenase family) [Rhodoblastus acidophilus]MCW2331216.1 NAD(P)-dependent dehydrogenase (short-subunit alcohol dehydrogenase family) [Rhodoblastus acidophilus]